MAVFSGTALLIAGVAGTGIGAFFGSQVDDAVEVLTGEKDGINPVVLALLAGGSFFVYQRFLKK